MNKEKEVLLLGVFSGGQIYPQTLHKVQIDLERLRSAVLLRFL